MRTVRMLYLHFLDCVGYHNGHQSSEHGYHSCKPGIGYFDYEERGRSCTCCRWNGAYEREQHRSMDGDGHKPESVRRG